MLNSVLLPQPLGPTTVTNSPLATFASKPDSAVTLPNVLLIACSSSNGVDFAGASADPARGNAFVWMAACTDTPLYNGGCFAHTKTKPRRFVLATRVPEAL